MNIHNELFKHPPDGPAAVIYLHIQIEQKFTRSPQTVYNHPAGHSNGRLMHSKKLFPVIFSNKSLTLSRQLSADGQSAVYLYKYCNN